MERNNNVLFLSLRPEYAELLLAGEKTVELRRIRPRAPIGTDVLLYASSPRCELVGICSIGAIGQATPDDIWKLHGSNTGIGRTAFHSYFRGASQAVAITVKDPRRLESPISLSQLRAEWVNFQPPQSFRYVSYQDALRFLSGQDAVLESAISGGKCRSASAGSFSASGKGSLTR
jgi:predicted transcriptional regulator